MLDSVFFGAKVGPVGFMCYIFSGFAHIVIIQHELPIFFNKLRPHYTFMVWNVNQLSLWLESHPDADPLFLLEGSSAQITVWMDALSTLPSIHASFVVVLKQRVRTFHTLKRFTWKRLDHHFDCDVFLLRFRGLFQQKLNLAGNFETACP